MKQAIHLASSALVIAALTATASAQSGPRVRHVPPAEASPAEAMVISASVDRGWEEDLELRYRPQGTAAWQGAAFTRQDPTTYVVTVPAEAMAPPGLEYFIVSAGGQIARFGSPEAPHKVNVFRAAKEMKRLRQLARHDNKRAELRVAGEWVDYGTREWRDTTIGDHYYRIDASASYRVLSLPLESLRFGFTRLVGLTPLFYRGDDGSCDFLGPEETCDIEVGFKGGGWFELGFLLSDGVELDTRGMVMATQTGFNVGGRAELRIGDSRGSHVGFGGEYIGDVGAAGFVRLGWGTVPALPMAATIEVTKFPSSDRATAVRLIYDVGHSFEGGVRVGARVGYQARDQLVGGVTLGLNTSLEF